MRKFKIIQSITNRAEDCISRYLIDISQIDLLQQEEELKLAKSVHNGDQVAMEKLIKTNLRFVVSVAKQYQNKGMNLSDLISEGNMGLIKAAHRYDYTKGFRFISFAVYWIRQSIIQAISEQKRMVRLPGNQIHNMNMVAKAKLKLEQELERLPNLYEIAELLKLPEEKITDILLGIAVSVSVDVQSHTHTELSLLETLRNENSLDPIDQLFQESLSVDLIRVLNKLPIKQRIVMKYWYGVDQYPQLSFRDIAQKMGLTSERVRQLRNKAIETLERLCKVSGMMDYLNAK